MYQWLTQQESNYGGKAPIVYSYDSYVREHLQHSRLTRFPLIVANYTYDATVRPACPPPWSKYMAIQYTDKATNIPGVPGSVDGRPVNVDVNVVTSSALPAVQVPAGWRDDGTTLTAPNGHRVVQGFRRHILATAWKPENVPLEEEHHVSQVLLHNAVIGAGQIQLFRDSMLWYTPAKGVIEESRLGEEIRAAYEQIAALSSMAH